MVKIDVLAYFFTLAEDSITFLSVKNVWKVHLLLQPIKGFKVNIYNMPKYGKNGLLALN